MSDCERLSDRVPEVASGASRWTEDDERHLAGCADCRSEWELVRHTARLADAGIGLGLDEEVLADAVLGRVRQSHREEKLRRRAWTFAGLAAAAAVMMVVWTGGPGALPRGTEPVETAALRIPIPELDELGADELRTVLQLMDEPLARDFVPDTSSWSEVESLDLNGAASAGEG